jgi:hypothetical protein
MTEINCKATEILICYAQEDQGYVTQLASHLSVLKRLNLIQASYNREIITDTSWRETVGQCIYRANVILLLVSPKFMASQYCYGKEMQIILERDQRGEACAIPVLLQSAVWKDSPLGLLEALPKGEKPVFDWPDMDEAFVDVAKGVCNALTTNVYQFKQIKKFHTS